MLKQIYYRMYVYDYKTKQEILNHTNTKNSREIGCFLYNKIYGEV
mgnify:CR=1 FL=1